MTTPLDIITRALRDIGAIAVSENPTDAEAQDALDLLNDMLDTWSTEKLMVYLTAPQVFNYKLGQATCTIGPGGDFNVARPIRIQDAYNRDTANQGSDIPIYVTSNYEEYADIITKQTQSELVTCLYYDSGFPLQTLYMWPIPNNGAYQLVLWTWSQLTAFATFTQVLSLPPGFYRALRSNLAIELCPSYGKTPNPILEAIAVESKAQIKRINLVTPLMRYDSALTRQGKVFNWLTGDTI